MKLLCFSYERIILQATVQTTSLDTEQWNIDYSNKTGINCFSQGDEY